jgi:group I intron endonuclease
MLIYKATNKINNHVYIGKSIRSLHERKREHLQYANKRQNNIYFYNALKKYGEENFEWEILTETNDKNKLNLIEKFYIAGYKKITKLYNQKEGGDGGTYKGRPISEERRKKISKSLMGNIPWNKGKKMKGVSPNKGKKHTQEMKDKISKTLKEYFLIEENRNKLRMNSLGKKQTKENIKKRIESMQRNKLKKMNLEGQGVLFDEK